MIGGLNWGSRSCMLSVNVSSFDTKSLPRRYKQKGGVRKKRMRAKRHSNPSFISMTSAPTGCLGFRDVVLVTWIGIGDDYVMAIQGVWRRRLRGPLASTARSFIILCIIDFRSGESRSLGKGTSIACIKGPYWHKDMKVPRAWHKCLEAAKQGCPVLV